MHNLLDKLTRNPKNAALIFACCLETIILSLLEWVNFKEEEKEEKSSLGFSLLQQGASSYFLQVWSDCRGDVCPMTESLHPPSTLVLCKSHLWESPSTSQGAASSTCQPLLHPSGVPGGRQHQSGEGQGRLDGKMPIRFHNKEVSVNWTRAVLMAWQVRLHLVEG